MGERWLSCIALCTLVACATPKPQGRTVAEVLFKEAKELVDDGRYIMAQEKLDLLRSRYPYSLYATHAELMRANIYFLQENYVEAAAAYTFFRDFHPKHKKMAYIISQIAESFFRQTPTTYDRDLSTAQQAIKYYDEVAQKYPRSKYAKPAREKIAQIKTMLNQKEQYIADFYFKTKVYSAARYRYLEIIGAIKDASIVAHAMERVIESSYRLKEYKKCSFYINKYFAKLNKKSKQWLQRMKTRCVSGKSKKAYQYGGSNEFSSRV